MQYFLLFLYLSAFISITLMEGLILLTLAILLYQLFRESPKLLLRGSIAIPLHMYISTTVFSTILFFPKMALKAMGEGLFQLTYFLKLSRKTAQFLAEMVPKASVLAGVLLFPALIYNSLKGETVKLLWGGHFEVGNFYSIFAATSLILAVSSLKKGRKGDTFIYSILFALFTGVVLYSTKRSSLLALIVVILMLVVVLYRNNIISAKLLTAIGLSTLSLTALGYLYLSKHDPRFQLFNRIITGEIPPTLQNLDRIGSSRVRLMLDGLKIIEKDIQEKRVANLLIGHGIRSGLILPHWNTPRGLQRYESVFIISEFIEKGLVGLIGEVLIIIIALRRFLAVKIRNIQDINSLTLYIPLLHHLGGSIFTFFWDAVLPVYLLLFKAGEVYHSAHDLSKRNPHLSG